MVIYSLTLSLRGACSDAAIHSRLNRVTDENIDVNGLPRCISLRSFARNDGVGEWITTALETARNDGVGD